MNEHQARRPGPAPGPLTVSTINPRYFTIAGAPTDQRAVYLNGARQQQFPFGSYAAVWFSVAHRVTDNVTVAREGGIAFTPPFAGTGPAVLYLKEADQCLT